MQGALKRCNDILRQFTLKAESLADMFFVGVVPPFTTHIPFQAGDFFAKQLNSVELLLTLKTKLSVDIFCPRSVTTSTLCRLYFLLHTSSNHGTSHWQVNSAKNVYLLPLLGMPHSFPGCCLIDALAVEDPIEKDKDTFQCY